MSLEDLTGPDKYIDALVRTNPDGATDPKSQGDDHLRGIKNALLNTFPNVSGPVTATQAEMNQAAGRGQLMPPGVIAPYAGAAVPDGWLLCDGRAVSRTTYSALFAAIGTTFGGGDGSATFNLPDPRGRAAIGAGTGEGLTARALGAKGGAETHKLTSDEMPEHDHLGWSGGRFERGGGSTALANNNTYSNGNLPDRDRLTKTSEPITRPAGGSQAHNNMQPFITLNMIIKT